MPAIGDTTRRLILSFCASFAVASCAGGAKEMAPVPLGNDTYMVGVNAMRGSRSNAELAAQALSQANAYCAALGRNAEIQERTVSGSPGWVPQDARVVFRCVERPAAPAG
jgi:hypothetical protein